MTCIALLIFHQELIIANQLKLIISSLTNIKKNNFSIESLPNGLSDQDAQIFILHNINIQISRAYHHTKRLINEFTIPEFKLNLGYETWEVIFTENDADVLFNCFLNTYMRIFYQFSSEKDAP